ncbi:MAG TPA: POTRA domain-containing protein [Bryobacteraceae bacterium]|nr:POTRA domain-containing protein [Bryobacteraceae bacterium]
MNRLPIAILLVSLAGAASSQTHHSRKPAATPTAPAAKSSWPIETLSVEGNHNYTAEQVLAVLGLHTGEAVDQAKFDAARVKLSATGAFNNVAYRYAPAKDGQGYDVTFEVSEIEQVYPLRFEDLPATDAQLRAWLKQKDPLFAPKIPATEPVVNRYVQWVTEYLAQLGDHEPITGKLASDATPDLSILIRPAKARPSVAHVVFTNTGDLPSGLLQTQMYGVAIGMPYTEPRFRLLLDSAARPLYEARGMIRVAFPKITTEPAKDVDGITVTVQVEQGPVYKLDRVRFTGADTPYQELVNLAHLRSNQPANFDDVKAAQARIRDSLRNQGHLDASSQIKRDVNDGERTVDVTFQIQPGPLYTMGQLNIVGLDIESEPVIRKMWGLAAGRPFNPGYPDHFLSRVKEGGIFDNLKTTSSDTKVNPGDHSVDVTLYFNKKPENGWYPK